MTMIPSEVRAAATAAVEYLVASHDLVHDPAALDRAADAWHGARDALVRSLSVGSTFTGLVVQARLTVDEAVVLAVALGAEIDERLQRLLVHVHAAADRPLLELGDVVRLSLGATAAGPASGLFAAGLASLDDTMPWSRRRLRVAPAVLWALHGDPAPDPDLPIDVLSMEAVEVTGEPTPRSTRLLVTGPDRTRRRLVAAARCAAPRLLVAPVPNDDAGWEALVREATLTAAGVVVEIDGDAPPLLRRWIVRARHLTWAISSRTSVSLDLLPAGTWDEAVTDGSLPDDDEWRSVLGDRERRHALTTEQLRLVGRALPLVDDDLDAAVRRLVSSRLEELARRIRPSRRWSDLVLPPVHTHQLRELVDRYHAADRVYNDWGFPPVPSRGIVALFSGPSGTGKTLAAEVIAAEIGLDLFKMDLSSVVSKYIGETEKNLEQLFDAAGAGNMVLFFDEADALFGKRSEVKDAHDKYANLETSYLLQRLETYDGVVILATNFEKNIDDAFLRRIHTRVDFAPPTEQERAAIWRRHLEYGAPLEDIDHDELARRFEMTGGSIRNAAVHAAFLAAAESGPITMERVVRGVAREYRKLGRLLTRDGFGPYFDVVAADLMR